ncbi:hypothetical protein GCM10020000_15250 [Streptomyces olivoverticillatus]
MTEQTERPLAEPRPLGEIRSWPRSFADRLTAPLPGVRALARLAREGRLRPSADALREIPDLPLEPGPLPAVDATTVAVTWAGHASWVVRVGGLTILTDPVWSRRILGTPSRVTPVGVRWADLPRIDAVVISHNHYDHLDAPHPQAAPARDAPPPPGLASRPGPGAAASPASPNSTGGRRSSCRGWPVRSASTSSPRTTGASAPSPTPAVRCGAAGC